MPSLVPKEKVEVELTLSVSSQGDLQESGPVLGVTNLGPVAVLAQASPIDQLCAVALQDCEEKLPSK